MFNGGGGDDTFRAANSDADDSIDAGGNGGTGDTVDYSAASAAVTMDLTGGTASGTSVGDDTISGFENATGGAGADIITGTTGVNTLVGGGGGDTFTGGTGNDIILGGSAAADTSSADKAIYAGNLSTYQVTYDPFAAPGADGIDITVAGGADGTDTLDGVELLQFADVTLDLERQGLPVQQLQHADRNVRRSQIGDDFANADSGTTFTIRITAGDVPVGGGQVVINKNITIEGAGLDVSHLKADFNTVNDGGNGRGMILVNAGKTLNVTDLTIDGERSPDLAGDPQLRQRHDRHRPFRRHQLPAEPGERRSPMPAPR